MKCSLPVYICICAIMIFESTLPLRPIARSSHVTWRSSVDELFDGGCQDSHLRQAQNPRSFPRSGKISRSVLLVRGSSLLATHWLMRLIREGGGVAGAEELAGEGGDAQRRRSDYYFHSWRPPRSSQCLPPLPLLSHQVPLFPHFLFFIDSCVIFFSLAAISGKKEEQWKKKYDFLLLLKRSVCVIPIS